MNMDRRNFIASASMTTLAVAGNARLLGQGLGGQFQAPSMAPTQTFRTALAGCPTMVGCSLDLDAVNKNPAYGHAVVQDIEIFTPEAALKWGALRPTPDTFNFTQADAYFRFAQANGLAIRGHNLCWNDNSQPKWFNSYLNKSNAEGALTQHIKTVVGRYKGQVQSWDVVNEAIIQSDGRPDFLSTHPWTELIGPQYIDLAFHTAHEVDPKTPLVLNEVNMESNDARGAANRTALLNLVRGMKKRGVPLNAIGLESHNYVETPLGGDDFRRFIMEMTQQHGLDIYITELDMNDKRTPGIGKARDGAIADAYARYLEIVMSLVVPEVIVFWSFNNGDNWLDRMAVKNAHQGRPDNDHLRPGLIDSDLRPTPSHDAVLRAIKKFCR